MRPFYEVESEAMILCQELGIVDDDGLNLIARIVHHAEFDGKSLGTTYLTASDSKRLVGLLNRKYATKL